MSSSAAFPGHEQVAGCEAEQMGHELALKLDAGAWRLRINKLSQCADPNSENFKTIFY